MFSFFLVWFSTFVSVSMLVPEVAAIRNLFLRMMSTRCGHK